MPSREAFMNSLEQATLTFPDAVGVGVALAFFIDFLVITLAAPEWFMRLSVRWYMYWLTPAQRERACKRSDRLACYYLGTTGDSKRDAAIRGFDRLYARGLGIASVVAVLGMIVIAVMHGLHG